MGIYNSYPDFNSEEVSIIKKNKEDLHNAVQDMAEHLPKEDPGKGLKMTQNEQCNYFLF